MAFVFVFVGNVVVEVEVDNKLFDIDEASSLVTAVKSDDDDDPGVA
jgi:hypothetical protein